VQHVAPPLASRVVSVPNPNYRALGVEVARLRAAKGWSLDKLADESGVARNSVINVEAGRHVVRLPTLHALAHALGTSLSQLVRPLCVHEENNEQETQGPTASGAC